MCNKYTLVVVVVVDSVVSVVDVLGASRQQTNNKIIKHAVGRCLQVAFLGRGALGDVPLPFV